MQKYKMLKENKDFFLKVNAAYTIKPINNKEDRINEIDFMET